MILKATVVINSVMVATMIVQSSLLNQLPICKTTNGMSLDNDEMIIAITNGCLLDRPAYLECDDGISECVEAGMCADSTLNSWSSAYTSQSGLKSVASGLVCCENRTTTDKRNRHTKAKTEDQAADEFTEIGVSQAAPGEFPWMAIVGRLVNESAIQYLSGGALIHQRVVLTTAHMIDYNAGQPTLVVKLGQLDILDQDHTITITVQQSVIHPDFHKTTRANNLAILVLASVAPSHFTNIAPVQIPERNSTCFSSWCSVSGWGLNSKNQVLYHLQKLPVNPIPKYSCTNYLQSLSREDSSNDEYVYNNPDSLCLEGTYEDVDVCIGFQGSPFVCRKNLSTDENTLLGFVSDNIDCRNRSQPIMLVDVRAHLLWINQQLKDVWKYERVSNEYSSGVPSIRSFNAFLLFATCIYVLLF